MKDFFAEYYKTLSLAAALSVVVFLRALGYFDFLTVEKFREIIREFGPYAPFAYIVFFVSLSFIFVPNVFLIALAGMLFPPFLASSLALISTLLMAGLGYYLGRKGLTNILQKLMKGRKITTPSKNQGFLLVLVSRFLPIPYLAQSILCGSLRARPTGYFLISLAEILPWIIGITWFGEGILSGEMNHLFLGIGILLLLLISSQILRRFFLNHPDQDQR
ncbi:MAG: TVP38/TMEM64 family protein [Deltaproteobacteria bacterium]|nr:TVP38/TMEM64 family protein [Deltaproteobacteria bacterium]